MADFDPNSLTWRVFVINVREKHGHELVLDDRPHRHRDRGMTPGICRACGVCFYVEATMRIGWEFLLGHRSTSPCPGTRPS